jgi:hypothetical protein
MLSLPPASFLIFIFPLFIYQVYLFSLRTFTCLCLWTSISRSCTLCISLVFIFLLTPTDALAPPSTPPLTPPHYPPPSANPSPRPIHFCNHYQVYLFGTRNFCTASNVSSHFNKSCLSLIKIIGFNKSLIWNDSRRF